MNANKDTALLHISAVIYKQGDFYGFEIHQNGSVLTQTPPIFKTAQEAKEASSGILSFAAEKVQEELPIKRMLRVQRDLPEEL